VADEVANGAFWFGLIGGVIAKYGDVTKVMDFDTAKSNFMAASRMGLHTLLSWVEGKTMPAQELICEHLIPLAEAGLAECHVDRADIDRYLGIIDARTRSGRTGSKWILDSYAAFHGKHTQSERLSALAAAMWSRQQSGKPVHTWSVATLDEGGGWEQSYARVDQYMTTDLFTVHEDELIDLAACLMDWNHIRHIPVKNDEDCLVGILSARQLLRFLGHDKPHDSTHPIAAKDVMERNPITVTPDTSTLDAVEIMRRHRISCLPVTSEGRVVGIVSERDFMRVASELVEERLSCDSNASDRPNADAG
jgi:CBS domain-containing protein